MKVDTTIKSQARTASHLTIEVGRQGGLTVDKELYANSKNPVANAPVTVALNNINKKLKQAREDIDALTIVPGVGVDSAVQETTEAAPNVADAEGAVALGSGNKNSSPQSVVEGVGNEITSGYSGNHVEGGGHSVSSTERSHIEGDCNVARSGKGMHVEGGNNEASENYSHTEGFHNINHATGSHVEGISNETKGSAMSSHVEGSQNIVSSSQSHTEGSENNNSGVMSHIEGSKNIGSGEACHIEGSENDGSGDFSHTEGLRNVNKSVGTHVEGMGNEVDNSSMGSHAEGTLNKITNASYAHVEGMDNKSSGPNSHTEGTDNENSAYAGHVEGKGNIGSGDSCHVEGHNNEVSATNGHAGGEGNVVSAHNAFAHGHGLKATIENEAVFGKFNYPRQNAIFSVGAGESDTARRTPFFVDKNGNTWIRDWNQANLLEDPNSVVELQDYLSTLEFKASDIYTIDTSILTPWEDDIPGLDENVHVLGELSDQQMTDVEQALSSGKLLQISHSEGRRMTMTDCISGYTENENGDNVFVVTAYYWDPVWGGMAYFIIANNLLMMMSDNSTSIEYAKEEAIRIAQEYTDKKTENAVKPEDYYPKMSVGFADNLIGRGEATAEEFTYRASAGMGRSITDDTARVKKIKGNSVVWNQHLSSTFIESESTIHLYDGGVPKGHKFALLRSVADGEDNECYYFPSEGIFNYSLGSGEYAKIFTNNHDVDNDYVMVYSVGKSGYVQLVDLTKMFTAGNEPSTIEEFYARIPSGIDIKAYNEGEIISVNTEAIKTVGFNQWDEQWELGYIKADGNNGGYVANYIRSKNYIPVIGGMRYFLNRPASTSDCQVFCYDKSKNFISQYTAGSDYSTRIPLNAAYVRFYLNYGAEVYHNDICYNLSHTGVENGKYKPYIPFTRELPIIQKYFPNGMRSAGNAFDSIEWDSSKQKWVAVQRIGSVDLGTLDWTYYKSIYGKRGGFMVLDFTKMALQNPQSEIPNLTCTSYTTRAIADALSIPLDKIITGASNNPTRLIIYDSTYSDSTTFLSAMQGVMLNYELAEPIVTEIEEENINFDYYVEDFGTEEAWSSVPSAPFRADVVYTFNAVDTIRNNYLAIEEMKKQMAQMQNAISAMQVAQVKVEE